MENRAGFRNRVREYEARLKSSQGAQEKAQNRLQYGLIKNGIGLLALVGFYGIQSYLIDHFKFNTEILMSVGALDLVATPLAFHILAKSTRKSLGEFGNIDIQHIKIDALKQSIGAERRRFKEDYLRIRRPRYYMPSE